MSDKTTCKHEQVESPHLSISADEALLDVLNGRPEIEPLMAFVNQVVKMATKAAALQLKREASKATTRIDDNPAGHKHTPHKTSRFLDNTAAAQYLNLSPRTLEKFRVHGGGPLYRKFGSRVLYAIQDLETYANSHRKANTSQYSR